MGVIEINLISPKLAPDDELSLLTIYVLQNSISSVARYAFISWGLLTPCPPPHAPTPLHHPNNESCHGQQTPRVFDGDRLVTTATVGHNGGRGRRGGGFLYIFFSFFRFPDSPRLISASHADQSGTNFNPITSH